MEELRILVSFIFALTGFALALLASVRPKRGQRRRAGI